MCIGFSQLDYDSTKMQDLISVESKGKNMQSKSATRLLFAAIALNCGERQELTSRSARLAYPVRDGIPVLLENEARTLSDDELGL